MPNTDSQNRIHHGRNIKRFREMFGIKQEALALELGDDWSQKKVSRLEENERVEEELLEQVAKILKVPVGRLRILMSRQRLFISIRFTTIVFQIQMALLARPIVLLIQLKKS